ncbi:hypothetical protein SLA2020_018190 [Shorea laevis]
MVGITPLTKSLPETYEDVYRFFTIDDDKGGVVDVFSGSPSMDSTSKGSEYVGIISTMVSRVQTTSAIDVLNLSHLGNISWPNSQISPHISKDM